ncbi:translation elongation factor Ts [Helicobacter sp. 13S00401-1]|uniref:translation elongation factor Ts n=1 Tax=Helicobacter sp. 13S00401-1 TaxID=1905758 RepID=UPI000BA6CCD3|nr:translation elongation factor Ts [Helicobacter sp. 13S00401-1]PAF49358.1 translation elongation factor Ts [Helicobacter sp. 13S00401-1]
MEISAKLVKELRDKTDAGIMECKGALKEASGDIEQAIEILRKKGLSKAGKKGDRVASEGVIAMKIAPDFKKATLIELNSETDFVAKNDGFKDLVNKTLDLVFENAIDDVSKLASLKIEGMSYEEYLKSKIATIGENIVVRRLRTFTCSADEIVNGYVHHNFKLGALIKIQSPKANELVEVAKGVAMHAATMKPSYLCPKCVSDEVIAKETEIAKELLAKEGKPESMWDKILPGKIAKFYEEVTLLKQKYILDDKKSIEAFVNDSAKALQTTASIVDFVRFELGEGIEKKVDNFAEEVAAQMK